MRIEEDILGTVELEDDVLYGINTYRALNNFKLERKKTSLELIYAIAKVKKAAASTYNMCVNEVIANLALLELGHKVGEYTLIHPLDDVNRGQSTNDVYPTALRIAAIDQLRILSENCAKLQESLQQKKTNLPTSENSAELN